MQTSKKLIRAEAYDYSYDLWKIGTDRHTAIRRIREMYELSVLGRRSVDCDVIQTPTYAMFIIHALDDWDTDDYRYLMDFWKERILEEGYYNYMSDKRRDILDGGVHEKIERHYMKPDVFEEMRLGLPINRRYGNLTMELVFYEDEVDFLKITMGFYHERNRARELGLERLMEVLLKS